MSEMGELRKALHDAAACLRKYRPGETGERQAALLEQHAQDLREESDSPLDGHEYDGHFPLEAKLVTTPESSENRETVGSGSAESVAASMSYCECYGTDGPLCDECAADERERDEQRAADLFEEDVYLYGI